MIMESRTRQIDPLNVLIWILVPLAWLTLLGVIAWKMFA